MTTFVLIHGGWRGGWIYQRLARILRNSGHEVYAPSLPGSAEHVHQLTGDISLSTHIADVVNLFRWEDLRDVTLVGHSYGGMVITGVADQLPDRITDLVYLDAAVPGDGQSFLDIAPASAPMFIDSAGQSRGLFVAPVPAVYFSVNEADAPMVDELSTPFPFATCVEKLALTGGDTSHIRRTYILAEGWENPYVDTRDRVAKEPDWDMFSVACGHDAMLDDPDGLAKILLR